MSVEEDFEEWWMTLGIPKEGSNAVYSISKAAWRRCATLAKERYLLINRETE